MSHASFGSSDLIYCQIPYAFEALFEHERPGSTCYFSLHFYNPGYDEQRAFSQICCFSPSSYPKYSQNPFTFSQTEEQREWVACREHNKMLGKRMLSGSRVQRPGHPNLVEMKHNTKIQLAFDEMK